MSKEKHGKIFLFILLLLCTLLFKNIFLKSITKTLHNYIVVQTRGARMHSQIYFIEIRQRYKIRRQDHDKRRSRVR